MQLPAEELDPISAYTQTELAILERQVKEAKEKHGVDSVEARGRQEEYARAYETFIDSVNPDLIPTEIPEGARVKQVRLSAIGANIGDRLQENASEDVKAQVQEEAYEVHRVLSKMTVDQRVALMDSFNAEVMPHLKNTLATMITVNVGKSADSAQGELSKALQWFTFLGDDEQKNVIKDVLGCGIKPEGIHLRDGKGQKITDIAQLSGKLNATFYEKSTIDADSLPPAGQEARGNGIAFSQPPKNYPFALGIGDPLLAMFAGNGTVMKVPAEMQDIMDTFAKYWNAHIAQYAQDNREDLGLTQDDVDVLARGKAMQVVTGYGYETIADNVRVVSSLDVGRQVYENYLKSKMPLGYEGASLAEDLYHSAKRFSAELAGANVMYIGPDLNEAELKKAAQQWLARVIDNNGMICTKIEDAMIHQDVAEEFRGYVSEAWSSFDPEMIGKAHTAGKVQGVHSDPAALELARSYLDDAQNSGATVIGGDIQPDGLSMTPAIVIWPDELLGKHMEQRAKNMENFAPITNFMTVADVDQAIEITNQSQCNLTGSIWTKDPEELAKFVTNTKLGSYNIFNPKHGSDNAPYGEHMGVYHDVNYVVNEETGETRTLHIPSNVATGGHSQILAHLKIAGTQNPVRALHFDGDALTGLNDEDASVSLRFNVQALLDMGANLKRDTALTDAQLADLASEYGWSMDELAPAA